MATINKITLPDGSSFDVKDNVSGYTTNTGTITQVKTTAGAHTTIDTSSGAAAFNVPTNTSHLTNDSGFVTTDEKLKIAEVSDTSTYYPIFGASGSTATTRLYDTGFRFQDASNTITINLGRANTKKGEIALFNGSYGVLKATTITSPRTWTFPDSTGTIALTSQIPTIKNLVDGSATGSVKGIGTVTEDSNYTIGQYAFTEGYNTKASGGAAHAEGGNTVAQGDDSHAEGGSTIASGDGSHAEGISTTASGNFSHAANNHTIAQRLSQTVIGEYNAIDYGGTALLVDHSTTRGDYAFIIGNGDSTTRSNAMAVKWDGGIRTYNTAIDTSATPSSDQWGSGILMYSSNGAEFGGIQPAYLTTDARRTYLLQRNSTGTASCNISVGFDSNDDPLYTFSNPAKFVKDLGAFPVGSVYVTNTNSNPGSYLGGTWSLFDKAFAYKWVSDAFIFNTTNTQSGAFASILRGTQIELRWTWNNKVALSDNDQAIGTLNWAKVGISDSSQQHLSFPIAYCDGCNAIGTMYLNADGSFGSHDWVSRAASLPNTTNQPVYCSHIINVQDYTSMTDSFCNKFYWKRTA